jgi:hypothetical protein
VDLPLGTHEILQNNHTKKPAPLRHYIVRYGLIFLVVALPLAMIIGYQLHVEREVAVS